MQKFANNWATVLSASLASTDTTLIVPTVQADKLTFGAGEYYDLTIDPNGSAPEILRITGKSGGVLTIGSREREGTTAPGTWAADTVIACTVTAGFVEYVQQLGADVIQGSGDPVDPPATDSSKYIDTINFGAIWLATLVPVIGEDDVLGWQKVWPQDADTFLPNFTIVNGEINNDSTVSLSGLFKTLLTFFTDTTDDGDNPTPYIRGTSFITVTTAADVEVRLEGSNSSVFVDEGSGFVSVGDQVVGFDLDSGAFVASFALAPGVYPVKMEAHLIIPATGTSYPLLQARVTSGAATARRGITEVLGIVVYGGGGGPSLPPGA